MQKLHPKAVWLFFLRFFGLAFFLVLMISFWLVPMLSSFFIDELEESAGVEGTQLADFYGKFWILAIGAAVLIYLILVSVIAYIWARLSYRYWGYELAANALKIEKGVIYKKYISIPYERIQNVDIYRGLMARILHLSVLHIQTAGYSGGHGRGHGWRTEGRLPGLAPQTAEELREKLVQKIKGGRQGL